MQLEAIADAIEAVNNVQLEDHLRHRVMRVRDGAPRELSDYHVHEACLRLADAVDGLKDAAESLRDVAERLKEVRSSDAASKLIEFGAEQLFEEALGG